MIRRLLRKSSSEHSSNMNNNNYTGPDTQVTRDNCFHSDPEDEAETGNNFLEFNSICSIILYSDPPMEISISVPNLSELSLALTSTGPSPEAAEAEADGKQNYQKLHLIKAERRAKNREKLMAMKRFSGFLKRPEILGELMVNNIC